MSDQMLSYTTYGRKGNPAVMLLHGFLGCSEDWQEVATALKSNDFVIAVDLPGHGRSVDRFDQSDYTMSGCAKRLLELMDAFDIQRCAVLGYSMGGRLALYFAVHHPARCNALILESASPGLRTDQERSARRSSDAAITERLLRLPFNQFLADWYAQPLFESLRKSSRFDHLLQRRRRNNPNELAISLRQMGTGAQTSLWSELDTLRIPVLLLTGQLDRKFIGIAEQMATACRTSRLCIIEHAGHTLHFEAPDRYIAEVRQFLMERT